MYPLRFNLYIAPGDYVARPDVQVVFAAGETEQFVEVAIEDDNVFEESEAFMAVLSLPVGSTGVVLDSASQATAIIEDDDGKLSLEIILIREVSMR